MRITVSPTIRTLFFIFFLPTAIAISAAPGDLDLTFGSGGIVSSHLVNRPNGVSPASLLVQPDGKIVVCGTLYSPVSSNFEDGASDSYFIDRYNASGTPDISFGTNGRITAPFGIGASIVGNDIALQADGKIVSVGRSYSFPGRGIVVQRYNPDGSPDGSFGIAGRVSTYFGGAAWSADRVAVMPDGRIVVAGFLLADVRGASAFLVVRYNSDGSLDTSFGGGGVATSASRGGSDVRVNAVLLEPNGRIIVAGARRVRGSGTMGLALLRFNADGSLDSGFGSNGEVFQTIVGNSSIATDMVLQPDGRIVVTAQGNGAAVARYHPDGSIDTSFADKGIFRMGEGMRVRAGLSLAQQSDGKLVAFGYGFSGSGSIGFGLMRLDTNGAADLAFGNGGEVVTILGTGHNIQPGSVTVQPDGNLLGYGFTWLADDTGNIALVRYESSGASISGRVLTPSGAGLRSAVVSITDPSGMRRTTTTSSFGVFSFDNLAMNRTYIVTVSSRRYRFPPRAAETVSSLTTVDLLGLE